MQNVLSPPDLKELHEMLDFPNIAVLILSLDGTFYKVSEKHDLLGWSSEEVSGLDIGTFTHPDDRCRTLEIMGNLVAGKVPFIRDHVIRCLKRDGTYLWVSWSAKLKDELIYCIGTDVSEKVAFEEELSARRREQDSIQNRFKTFFEQSNLPMEIFDLEGRPLEVNKAFCDLFNVSPGDLHDYNILLDPSTQELGLLPYLKRAYGGEAVEVPAFYFDPASTGKPGRARWLEAWFSPVMDNGHVKELAVILKDVTGRKETEAKLILSNTEKKMAENSFRLVSDRLGLAVKIGQVGIWEWVPGDEKVQWDETLEKIYGFPPGGFSGNLEEYNKSLHPDDRDAIWNAVREANEKKLPYTVEHRIVRPNGEIRWVQGSGTTLYNEKDEPVLMMGTAIDITDKKVAALDQKFLSEISEILSSSFEIKENLQKVCDIATSYFCDAAVVDQLSGDGSIVRTVLSSRDPYFSDKLSQIYEEGPNRHDPDHPLFKTLYTGQTVLLPDLRTMAILFSHKYGEEYASVIQNSVLRGAITVRLKGRESLLGTLSFFTQTGSAYSFGPRHKYLAEELGYRISMGLENSLLYQQSQEAIDARDEFLSIASHELKTPLTSLSLQNQMRLRSLEKGERHLFTDERLKKMCVVEDRQFKRLTRLIDDMLDISRIRANRLNLYPEKFDFCIFLKDLIDRLSPQFEASGCQLNLQLPESLSIIADSYRIEQVMINLLTNAMKYGANKSIRIEAFSTQDKMTVKVHDQGAGIGPDDLERIFYRFERAGQGRGISGLGLGLYISRQIVEEHSGSLFATSLPGQGATFVMEVPLGL